MAFLEIRDLAKGYGDKVVLERFHLSAEMGEFMSLLGPSGCGKTTVLHLIAGFLRPDRGSIALGGEEISDLPTHRRNLGLVFQSYALFPHMSVGQNVGFGLEQRRYSRAETTKAVAEALDMVRLDGFADRRPAELSGGQQQRVALARALVFKPRLLLLDESLSAIDKKLRVQMQVELRQIQKEVGITALFVTHDHEEALTMSDRVAVMRNGRIVQLDTPSTVYRAPVDGFVAESLGEANFLPGVVVRRAQDTWVVELDHGPTIQINTKKPMAPGEACTVAIRPEDIDLLAPGEGTPKLAGRIRSISFAGNTTLFVVEALARGILVRRPNTADGRIGLAVGDAVALGWAPGAALVLSESRGAGR